MSEFLELLLKILVILNPVGALLLWNRLSWPLPGTTRLSAGIVSGLLVLALLVAMALLGETILDFLKISPSSFQISTGILLLLSAMRLFVRRDPFAGIAFDKVQEQEQGQPAPVVPVALLTFWVATPATLAAALLYGVTRDRGLVLAALAVAAVITTVMLLCSRQLEATFRRVPLREIGRALGMALIVLAVDFIVDGITNV